METPMKGIIELLKTLRLIDKTDLGEDFLWHEKEFAKQCFEAGRIFGMDNSYSIEWGEDTTQPDFDNWYKQFEK